MVDLGDVYDFSGTGRYEISYNVSSYDLFDEKGTPAKAQGRACVRHDQRQGGRARGQGQAAAGSAASRSRPDRLQRRASTAQISQRSAPRGRRRRPTRRTRRRYLAPGQAGALATRRGSAPFASHALHDRHVALQRDLLGDANAGIVFDCSSKQNVYAYVYPDQPYTIYLGRGLLDGAGGRHRFPGRHADPRDEPLRRRRGHR